ncbi:hypothetical protein [Fodinicola acaciae]|uniref:hypothetical protein n=1 Tax=Fodinicola acaciae TaxID=2681555 RepID=UPI0013D8BD1F|nr:hypothetical protein [Fodinicola acaciae]
MARRGDPYEGAYDRSEARRRLEEPSLRDLEPHVGIPFGRLPKLPTRWLLIAFVAFVALGAGFVIANPNGRLPSGNCDHTSLTLRSADQPTGYPVSWTATGPKGRYVLTVGVTRLDSQLHILATDKGNETDASVEGGQFTMDGCRASGTFQVHQGRGTQQARIFRLDGGAPRAVATAELTSRGTPG